MNSREADRFWAKVNKTGECWIWTGSRNALGYGSFGIAGHKTELAHRTAWRLTNGEDLPSTVKVCHRCDNPPCVRPDHLFLGSQADNVADQIAKGRRHRTNGAKNGRAKLSVEQVLEIRRRYRPGEVRIIDLATEFNVSKSQIWNVVSGREWNEYPA